MHSRRNSAAGATGGAGGNAVHSRPVQIEGLASSQSLSRARITVSGVHESIKGHYFTTSLLMGKTVARQSFARFSGALDSVEALLSSSETADRKLASDFLTKFCAACEKAHVYAHRNLVTDDAAARGRELLARAQ